MKSSNKAMQSDAVRGAICVHGRCAPFSHTNNTAYSAADGGVRIKIWT